MERLEEGQTICPHCGHDNERILNEEGLLPEGTILNGKYLVGRVLGRGGFGITYLGVELTLKVKVAIKEYFPNGISSRQLNSGQVKVQNQAVNSEGFEKGKEAFQQEAETLAIFNSPSIAHVREYFLENNTAYIVMDYVDGIGLTQEIRRCGGHMPWQRVVDLTLPMMRELDNLHRKNLIHRDIKPDNIKIIRDENTGEERMVLLDFGAARSFASANLTGTYTQILTPGFAPFEQYQARTHLGPYTDIYALCATMYAAITGEKPPSSPDRVMGEDGLKPLNSFGLNIPENIENAILHGLAVDYRYRQQTMAELYREIKGSTLQPSGMTGSPVYAPGMSAVPEPENLPSAQTVMSRYPEPKAEKQDKPAETQGSRKKTNPLLWILPVLLLVFAAVYFLVLQPKINDGIPEETRLALYAAGTAEAENLQTQIAESTAPREAVEFEITQTAKLIYSNLINTTEPTEPPTETMDPTKTAEARLIAEIRSAEETTEAERLTETKSAKMTATQETVLLDMTRTAESIFQEETLSAEKTAEAQQLIQTESAERTATKEAIETELTLAAEQLLAVYAAQTEAARPTETPTATPEPSATFTPTPDPTPTTVPTAIPTVSPIQLLVENGEFTLPQGIRYTLPDDDAYIFSNASKKEKITDGNGTIGTLSIEGEIYNDGEKNGFPSYYVNNDDLAIKFVVNKQYVSRLKKQGWEPSDDLAKSINGVKLVYKGDEYWLDSGALAIQVSGNGKNWITYDFVNDWLDRIDKRGSYEFTPDPMHLDTGCYYRIVFAYELKKEKSDKKFLGGKYDYANYAEAYEFYLYNEKAVKEANNNQQFNLGKKTRTGDNFFGEETIGTKDKHYGWDLGSFFITGYTEHQEINGNHVFLKNVGDEITLWFNLNQNIDALNGSSKLKIKSDKKITDQQFELPQTDFYRGALVIRYTDYQNITHDPVLYTNFLQAYVFPFANTKIGLFEEGDYEIALDYSIDKEHYRIAFTYSIRNNNCMVYPFDIVTKSEMVNSSYTDNGFYLDLARSRYLDVNVKRVVKTNGV
ncbi:MAG: protein kinase, partial [Anaerolineaceae bacterium]|nr:protein kinase [Anaerolineaceae bacterium]